MEAELTFLGSGTSMGVPTLGCHCAVCTSPDPRDKRLRPSVSIAWDGHLVLIDTGPDFRTQAIREHIEDVDAVLYTHSHADHILGLDDLRPISFIHEGRIPLYAEDATARVLEKVYDYTFAADARYPNRAQVDLHRLEDGVDLFGIRFRKIRLRHGDLDVAGFRFGPAAYLTDMNFIPDSSLEQLRGLDLVVLDALRHTPHATHANLKESLEWAKRIGARRTYFTHMSHEIGHAETQAKLPPDIELAYDGLRVPFRIA